MRWYLTSRYGLVAFSRRSCLVLLWSRRLFYLRNTRLGKPLLSGIVRYHVFWGRRDWRMGIDFAFMRLRFLLLNRSRTSSLDPLSTESCKLRWLRYLATFGGTTILRLRLMAVRFVRIWVRSATHYDRWTLVSSRVELVARHWDAFCFPLIRL